MDEKQAGKAAGALYERSLRDAMRRLRLQEAERGSAGAAMRDAECVRLEILRDKLEPVFAQVPSHIELFDTGLTPGDPPRLWVDMIAFVEMGRDKRTYRFLQDTRFGRAVILESDSADAIADSVTTYVAQRLIERERMLAERRGGPAAMPRAFVPDTVTAPEAAATAVQAAVAPPAPATTPFTPATPKPQSVRFTGLGAVALFLIGALAGAAVILAFAHLAARG
jgi:hypothetical protein